jgi:two-component system OmpR family sensor kinase
MTLTRRFSLFFLSTLAAVLVGFSATLYVLARTYLLRQVEDRLEAALDILSATAEVKPDGVEWESGDRPVALAPPPGAEAIAWRVCDDRGQVIDGQRDGLAGAVLAGNAMGWSVRSRRLPDEAGNASGKRERQSVEGDEKDKKYPSLVLTVALPLEPVAVTLRRLLLLLSGLSALLWLSAALVGGRLCRQALAPVRHMAEAAGSMNAADPRPRLPIVTTGDELEELNGAFNHLLARLQESFERQRRFTGDASHQLRTPLTAMLGQIEIALRRPRAAEDYHQVLRVLHGQALHLRQIVETLLFLARADADADAPPLQRLDLRAWLTEHLASWADQARSADFRTEIEGDGPLWTRAQAPLLGQLVDNLLENACKYSPAGTPITVRLAEEAGAVSLSVADSGCGIAAEDLPHVFEPFYRSAQVRDQGVAGIGLGLAVAQRIALALGGVLRVESQPGRGARFTLQMPVDDG